MVSRRDLLRFYRRAEQDGARTLAVGEPRQLQAVQAGNPFEQLLRGDDFRQASITQINRQKDQAAQAEWSWRGWPDHRGTSGRMPMD